MRALYPLCTFFNSYWDQWCDAQLKKKLICHNNCNELYHKRSLKLSRTVSNINHIHQQSRTIKLNKINKRTLYELSALTINKNNIMKLVLYKINKHTINKSHYGLALAILFNMQHLYQIKFNEPNVRGTKCMSIAPL